MDHHHQQPNFTSYVRKCITMATAHGYTVQHIIRTDQGNARVDDQTQRTADNNEVARQLSTFSELGRRLGHKESVDHALAIIVASGLRVFLEVSPTKTCAVDVHGGTIVYKQIHNSSRDNDITTTPSPPSIRTHNK